MKNWLLKKEIVIALIISAITNPFVLLIVGFYYANRLEDAGWSIFLFIVTGTFLPSIVYISKLVKHRTNLFKFVSIPQKDRDPIYLTAIYSFIFNFVIFNYIGDAYWVYNSMLVIIYLGIMYLVNRYIDKASVHASTLSFVTLYLIDKVDVRFSILLLVLPLVYWSRIRLHKHTWLQLFLGTGIGMLIGLLAWTF